MSHRRTAVPQLKIKYGEHAVAGLIVRAEAEKMFEDRNSCCIALSLFDLRGPLQAGMFSGSNLRAIE